MANLISDQSSIALFNRGPVTSIFTPPTSCVSTFTSTGPADSQMYFGHYMNGYFDNACFPSSTLTGVSAGNAWGTYYYSPAQCPSAWSHATTLTSGFGRSTPLLSLGPDTTAVVCCPSGFAYAGFDHMCKSSFASTTSTLLYINPVANNNKWFSTDANAASTIVITATSTYNIYGDGFPVWWQSSDLALFAAATKSSSMTTIASPTTRSSDSVDTQTKVNSSPTSSPTIATVSRGLSNGAKIGLALGVPLVVMAIGLMASFLYLRKCKEGRASLAQSVAARPPIYEADTSTAAVHEMYDGTPNRPTPNYELPGS